MKNIRILILLFTTTLFFIGCSNDDSDPLDPTSPASGISKLEFTSTGTFQNGSFVITDNPESSSDRATGVLSNSDNVAVVTFADDNQGFTFMLMFPANKGTHQITEENIAHIQYLGNQIPVPDFFFQALSGTITITDLEHRNLLTGGGVITRAKGSFNANLLGADFEAGEDHTQNVSGNFDLYSYSTNE